MSYIRIRKHYLHLPYILLGAFEFGILFLSFYFLENLQQAFNISPASHVEYSPALALIYAIILSCGSLAMGVYLALMREGFLAMFFRTLVAYCFLGALALTILAEIWPYFYVGGNNLFWVVMLSTGFTLASRHFFSKLVNSDQLTRKIVVIGTGASARQLQRDYEKDKATLGVKVIGYIGSGQSDVASQYCLEKPTDWLSFCRENRISEIVVAQEERRKSDGVVFPLEELIRCKLGGIDVINAVGFYEREFNQVKLSLLSPSWIIFADGFTVSKTRDFAKRLFDIFISVALGIVLLPFVLFAAFLVFIETGRPILYSQVRVGQHGKLFKIYKIRSMRQDAEKGGKAVWASANDSRITKVGAFIRNTRLDEIPQIYNVLKGEMSFVGPRPERPEFVAELNESIPFYSHRHAVKPGLMGWAQLNYPYGASVEDARGKLEYDLYYSKNHSFMMDFLIMIQTIEVVLLGKGVH
ncbi:TIGR03013 family PEP-CTERM/XrtA system glycosyltransferase [Reinekea marina]|uniref:TIGR03013 family XrtA/PEP-CTERM system glycosyltransferase n=1 Tax=Reinekea marina TaxID=1310421 RepID=A0ABV7WU54_9GAMM|nr:TIGR03013 family XrtA/PEP-CTERM system glycosyltransferase [Reinekea marina]MDN3648133.1 TIGR03013 family PEP-CTERM/XrtA system glycosyltransferase [Reinekea marina]